MAGEQTRYRIGDQMFTDLPSLLNFYKVVFSIFEQLSSLTFGF
jgi:hypothetical protein